MITNWTRPKYMQLRMMAVQIISSGVWCLVLMTVFTFVIDGCQSECEHSIERATVGKELKLMCNDMSCSTYNWSMIHNNGTSQQYSETSGTFTISKNSITSVMAVGGREYQCRCEGEGNCRNFTIWVNPVVSLNFSKPKVKVGESVNVTCTAESYPRANNITDYKLQHPSGKNVVPTHLTSGVDGVIHEIPSANSSDGGEYDCIVGFTVLVDGIYESVQSNKVQRNLTVYYGPPRIKRVSNFTKFLESDVVKSAILECEIENMEPGLKMWVQWVSVNGSTAPGQTNVTLRERDVFFLVLHNITRKGELMYECRLFSEHSSGVPTDKKTAVISEIITPSCQGEVTPTNEGNESCKIACSIMSALFFLLLIAIIVGIIIFKRSKSHRGSYGPELNNMRTVGIETTQGMLENPDCETPTVDNDTTLEENRNGDKVDETTIAENNQDHKTPVLTVDNDHINTTLEENGNGGKVDEDNQQFSHETAPIENHDHETVTVVDEVDEDNQLFSEAHLESASSSQATKPTSSSIVVLPSASPKPITMPMVSSVQGPQVYTTGSPLPKVDTTGSPSPPPPPLVQTSVASPPPPPLVQTSVAPVQASSSPVEGSLQVPSPEDDTGLSSTPALSSESWPLVPKEDSRSSQSKDDATAPPLVPVPKKSFSKSIEERPLLELSTKTESADNNLGQAGNLDTMESVEQFKNA